MSENKSSFISEQLLWCFVLFCFRTDVLYWISLLWLLRIMILGNDFKLLYGYNMSYLNEVCLYVLMSILFLFTVTIKSIWTHVNVTKMCVSVSNASDHIFFITFAYLCLCFFLYSEWHFIMTDFFKSGFPNILENRMKNNVLPQYFLPCFLSQISKHYY